MEANTTFNGIEQPGVVLGRPENPRIKMGDYQAVDIVWRWLDFFNNRLSLSLNYYKKSTEDLLLDAPIARGKPAL